MSGPSFSDVAAAASIIGFGIVCYLNSKKVSNASQELVSCSYEVEAKHVNFLKEMQDKFKIKDTGKAVRIAIQFAINELDEQKKLYTEKICNTCGGKKNKIKLALELHPSQKKFLETAKDQYNLKTIDKALRCILEYAESKGDRTKIFQTVRCSSC